MARRKLIAGNWKMNGWRESLNEIGAMAGLAEKAGAEVVVCVPATLLSDAATMVQGTYLKVGGQNCHSRASGAHTGEIAAGMLWDMGASHVILGHSERRAEFNETDVLVREKAEAALQAGLVAIVCVGENEAERDAGRTLDVVLDQMADSLPDRSEPDTVTIAYEPVWAIGSGRTPQNEDIAEVMGAIREALDQRFGSGPAGEFRLLYGGSVAGTNAAAILAIENVDGALVGGASLRAEDFAPIVEAAG